MRTLFAAVVLIALGFPVSAMASSPVLTVEGKTLHWTDVPATAKEWRLEAMDCGVPELGGGCSEWGFGSTYPETPREATPVICSIEPCNWTPKVHFRVREYKPVLGTVSNEVVVEYPPVEQCGEQTTWAPASGAQKPLSDSEAAACVTHKAEQRSVNKTANGFVPSETELKTFHEAAAPYSPLAQYVDGKPGLSNPSTDDLIQWGARKWGVPTNVLRAEYVQESDWYQFQTNSEGKGVEGHGFGDFATSNFWSTPAAAVTSGGAYTSLGITQIKSRPTEDPHPGTKELRWESTAFNIDYQAQRLRYFYDGLCSWCGTGYSAGQEWASVGAWFSPSPWNNTGAQSYVKAVEKRLSEHAWTEPGF